MIKVFVSQPMNGKTEDEILKERENIIEWVYKHFEKEKEQVYILDSFITGAKDVNALFCLGHSLTMLSKADYAIFAEDWYLSRGCQIEYKCCTDYGINILYVDSASRRLKTMDDIISVFPTAEQMRKDGGNMYSLYLFEEELKSILRLMLHAEKTKRKKIYVSDLSPEAMEFLTERNYHVYSNHEETNEWIIEWSEDIEIKE